MKKSRIYEIAHVGLKQGVHEYVYDLDNRFLEMMEYNGEPLEDFHCRVALKFEKLTNLFQLEFDINGSARVACDRCGDDMELKIWDEHKLIIKISFDESIEEPIEDDDVVYIPKHESVIDLSRWIYEFVLLSIPMQQVHGQDEQGNSLCNPKVLEMLDKHKAQAEELKKKNIWKDLDKLGGN